MPKVSIVLPTYNRVVLLTEIVRNLLNQTFRDIEILVVDDGSTDTTAEAMSAIADPRLRYLRKGRLGVPAIVNAGFEAATGKYCMICHDHDEYDPTMLAQFVAFLDAHPSVAFVFSGLILCDMDGQKEISRDIHDFPPVTPGMEFLRRQLLPRLDSCIGVWTMIRRAALQDRYLLEEVGGCADVELWHRLCLRGDVGYIKTPLVRVRGRDPKSQFFLAEAELMTRLLRGKRPYLAHAADADARKTALQNWRASVNRTLFSNYYKCLRAGNVAAIPTIRALAKEQAGGCARLGFTVISHLPRSVAFFFLRMVRSLRAGG